MSSKARVITGPSRSIGSIEQDVLRKTRAVYELNRKLMNIQRELAEAQNDLYALEQQYMGAQAVLGKIPPPSENGSRGDLGKDGGDGDS